jgi:hypothetical protein
MNQFFTIIKGDYRQRTRSYAFLITLAISLYVGYTFVPPPDANYVTVQIGKYVGDFNSAWIGHVTAMMTAVFLSLIGFFLINNSIKKDIETEVGMIIATTSVSNFKYLFSKALSNFLVLLSIVGVVFVMSILVFFFRAKGFPFELSKFILPFLFVTLPCMFLIACVAVVAEVFLGRRPVIQYIAFFFLFNLVLANVQLSKGNEEITYLDPFGVKSVSLAMQNFVEKKYGEEVQITMGFNFSQKRETKIFVFEGVSWSLPFLLSRIFWMTFGVAIVFGSSLYFHRFDVKERIKAKKKNKVLENVPVNAMAKEIKLSSLPPITVDYGIFPFIKTELLMLIRKGPRWFWLVNAGLMIAILFSPLLVAHSILLPILWFLQIGRLSDLITKEKSHRIHYFTYSAYQPLQRLLPSQIIAGIILMIALAIPLIVRYVFSSEWLPMIGILLGAVFIVLLSVFLGMVSGGKKLFEVLFFALTYANLNRIPFVDYFGSQWTSTQPIIILSVLIFSFAGISGLVRSYEIKHL